MRGDDGRSAEPVAPGPAPVAIVDPYSAGSALAPEFAERGVPVIAVLSGTGPPPAMAATWRPTDFDAVLVEDTVLAGDTVLAEGRVLAEAVAAYQPRCVIPGAETGVELADALAAAVTPDQANLPPLAPARRDKWHMARAIQTVGLPCLRQVCTDDADVAQQWLRGTGLENAPLVLKPPKSFGTDDVHLVLPGGDWRAVFGGILGRVNIGGQRNEAVLVQEFAAGTEYIVDSYSVGGRHGLVDLCRYTKASRGDRIGIYDCVDFLPPDDPAAGPLREYTWRVLDALGLRNGAAHSEVMMTAEGPRLLEVGARLAGAVHQELTRLATDDSQLDRTVRHWLDGAFRDSYQLLRHVRIAFLSAPRTGILRNPQVFDQAAALRTVHAVRVPHSSGDRVPETTDLFNTLGHVIFVGKDLTELHSDYRAVKEMEANLEVDPD
jgi:biotin carboxylase